MDEVGLADFEREAAGRLTHMAWDYFRGGAGDEVALAENRRAFARWSLRYRVLAGVGARDTASTVLGTPVRCPVLIAPTAFHQLACPEGEVATARAAGAEGTIMVLSTLANRAVEEVLAAASGPVWFQLYVYKDRGLTEALVRRAEAAGCRALVLTVDAPLLGRRERDVKNRFHLPPELRVRNVLAHGCDQLGPDSHDSGLASYVSRLLEPGLSWRDLEWLRGLTRLPILLKGVVRGDDAARAVELGAAGVVVSNHGGRQLDAAPASLDALEEVAQAVAGRAEVLLDGGVRRGTDVLTALALGARAVLIGRPVLWGLAVDGEPGVRRVLSLLRDEVDHGLALLGCRSPAEVSRDLAARRPS